MSGWIPKVAIIIGAASIGFIGVYAASVLNLGAVTYSKTAASVATGTASGGQVNEIPPTPAWPLPLDTKEYDARLLRLSNFKPPATTSVVVPATATTPTTTRAVVPSSPLRFSSTTNVTIAGERWPAAAPYPYGGAILPFHRILAYYGNFYSTRMGILGEYEPAYVLEHLKAKQAEWEAADPDTPVMPAIQYIAMVAQADAGRDGMYRAMMPDEHIEKAYGLAKEINGIMILDLQVGLSTIERELPKFREYLARPEVHLAIDPEFSMKTGHAPGKVIGTFDAADINYVINYMAEIVREHKLPPKVFVVHRFTQNMVTNTHLIKPLPEVQVVMHMDGWGSTELKYGTYTRVIEPEPVQFAGVKIFYKNDLKPPSTGLWTPADVLSLQPKPVYIQYQ